VRPITLAIIWYLVSSAICFVSYGLDKHAARRGAGNRTPETTLLVLGLIGGWPGGLLAQRLFRHKTQKTPFQVKFWIGVLTHVVIVWTILNTQNGVGQ
jgi:uncharacterized membrane protein YsdA (DUF1294 family)